MDQLDGSAGIAGGMLQYISDEYDKKLCLGFGLVPPTLQSGGEDEEGGKGKKYRARNTNTLLLWNAFNSYSTIFTTLGLVQDFSLPVIMPKAFPNLTYKVNNLTILRRIFKRS